jgi:hypothetical protein
MDRPFRIVSRAQALLCTCLAALAISVNCVNASDPVNTQQPVRLAVIGNSDAADLATLMTAQLSEKSGIVLVERNDLSAIGDEAKIEQMAGTDPAALGKLLHADGLVFLDKEGDHGRARLTAVGLGYVVFDWQLPTSPDPTASMRALADHVLAVAPKLLLPPGKAIPISLLNLRVDEAFADSAELERTVSLLLESRLSAVPEVIVLERRHADALGFEHNLSEPAPELLQGAYLVDGSIHVAQPPSGEITLTLRVRSPRGDAAQNLDVHGPRDNLPALVEILANRIVGAIGAPLSAANWQPKAEAREFLSEGIWGWQHHDLPAALEALDSAEMLGETASDLQAIRARVLMELASQKPTFYGGKDIVPRPIPATDRVVLIRRAWADAAAYRTENGESKLVFFTTNRNPEARLGDLEAELNTTEFHILEDLQKSGDSPLSESLRHDLRDRLGFDPASGKFPDVEDPDALAASVDEETAYFVGNTADPNRHWFQYLLGSNTFAKRFLKDPAAQQAAYNHCIDKLIALPAARLDGLMQRAGDNDPDTREKAYRDLVDELWKQKEVLIAQHRFCAACSRAAGIRDDVRLKYVSLTIPLLKFYLDRAGTLDDPNEYYVLKYLWVPKSFTPEEAAQIWPAFVAARARINAQSTKNGDSAHVQIDMFASDFRRQWPDIAIEDNSKLRWLTVDNYWMPGDGQGPEFHEYAMIDDGPDFVWVLGNGGLPNVTGLYYVHLPDLAATFIPTECGTRPYDVVQTKDALWVTYGEYPDRTSPIQIFLKRYDLAAKTWQTRRIPDITVEGLYAVDNRIYFNLWNVANSHEEGGVARYDWDADKLIILASSRRRPAQNQFDDRAGYQLHDIFKGPGGHLCVNADGGIYYAQETPGPWPEVADMPRDIACVTQGDQTLTRSSGGEVMLLDANAPEPIPLLAPVTPTDWRMGADKKMVKRLPDWAPRALWKASPAWGWNNIFGNPHYLGIHDGHFFALRGPTVDEDYFELLWFTKGRPDPVRIPIKFLIHGSAQEAIKQGFALPIIDGSSNSAVTMLVTPDGICFHEIRGFWFLPFAQINRYLAARST